MKFQQFSKYIHISIFMALLGCQVQNQSGITNSLPISSNSELLHLKSKTEKQHVKFIVEMPSSFKVQQQAQAAFVKLSITNGTDTIFATGADQNGFVAASTNPLALGATVATGNNWVATVGFYTNKTSTPIQELKTAFHVPVTGQININFKTHLMGEIVAYLQNIKSPVLNNPIDINAYQSFVDTLTGAEITGGKLSFTKLTALNPPNPYALSGKDLAIQIHTGQIATVNSNSANSLNLSSFVLSPSQVGFFQAQGMTNGLSRISIHPTSGNLFVRDRHVPNAKLYALSLNNASTKVSDFFSPVYNAGNEPNFYAADGLTAPVLGVANPTGSTKVDSVFVFERTSTANGALLKAFNQNNGNLIWSFGFDGAKVQINSSFRPTLMNDDNGTPNDETDDQDIVLYGLKTDEVLSPNTTGLYAIRNGVKQWYYATPSDNTQKELILGSVALSSDKSKIYFVTRPASGGGLHFITLNASDGTELNNVAIPVFTSASEPVVGTDGTVYFQGIVNQSGRLYAYNPDGTFKWQEDLAQGGFFPPVIDRVNGRDIIYVMSSLGILQSYFADDRTKRWVKLVRNQSTLSAPLIGLEPTGDRIIYVGIGNVSTTGETNLYAVRDKGTEAVIDWNITPGGAFWSGLTLKDSLIYLSTRDGGDGQFVSVQAIKTSTPNMPPNAPWPKQGKNLENSSR